MVQRVLQVQKAQVDQGVLAFRVDLLAQVSQHRLNANYDNRLNRFVRMLAKVLKKLYFRVFQVGRVAQVWTFLEVRDGLVVLVCSSDKNILRF